MAVHSAATTSLHPLRRERELEQLAAGETVDLLVVGGGVTGAGVALDAASRGLSVALVERADLAHGTSRWSSKLIHGGLRYLTNGGVGVAMESARERGVLMERTAPHLVRALPMVLPLEPAIRARQAHLAQAGLAAGEMLRVAAGTRRDTLPRPRRLTRAEALRLAPGLRAEGMRGALLTWEGQLTDDARLVVAIARTAAGFGARILTRCTVTSLSGDGAWLTDTVTGTPLAIRARAVVNATGVWASRLAPDVCLRPSRGTHLVVPARRLGVPTAGVLVPVPGQPGRYVFALPQPDGLAYVGLTDEPVSGEPEDEPHAMPHDTGFLLDTLNTALYESLTPADILGTFSGLRPLLDDAKHGDDITSTADLSRRHAVVPGAEGVITVIGGKLTTYRKMAEDAVNAAVRSGSLEAGPCRTRHLPLVGAAPARVLDRVDAPRRLVARYGTEAPLVLAEARESPELSLPLADGIEVTGAELVFALRYEGALTTGDLLDRRTRIGLVPADRERVAAVADDIGATYLPSPAGQPRSHTF